MTKTIYFLVEDSQEFSRGFSQGQCNKCDMYSAKLTHSFVVHCKT